MEEQRLIRMEKKDSGVIWIILNTPPLNLQTLSAMDQLENALEQVKADNSIRAVVLIGAGDRVFCAGSDVKEFPSLRGNFVEEKLRRENEVFSRLSELPIPTIAALNGSAMGGGYELALCCDFRIMRTGAVIGLPEINLGNFPGSGGPMRLVRLIGPARSLELMTLGSTVDCERAQMLGLVHEVVESECLEIRAQKLAEQLASIPYAKFKVWKELTYSAVFESSTQARKHAVSIRRELFF